MWTTLVTLSVTERVDTNVGEICEEAGVGVGAERGGLEVGVIIVSMHRILVQNSKSKDKINK